MQVKRAVGQGAQVLKYDILSALLVMAAQGDAAESRLALRLSLLITARFDWRRGRFNVGLRELARMWGVTERTAKREMAQMRARNWIAVARAAARGRVTEHQINIDVVMRSTMPFWKHIGPDFVARLAQAPEPTQNNVVPLHAAQSPTVDDGSLWAKVAERLHAGDPQTYQAWFARLAQHDHSGPVLTLSAPSSFIATYVMAHFEIHLLTQIVSIDRSVTSLQIVPV